MLTAILCLAPALALLVPLLARRYPGERTLLELRRCARPRRVRPRSSLIPRRAPALMHASGGLLLGRGLAVRPPPQTA